MKTMLTICALLAAMVMGGTAMACGGAAGGPLGRVTIKTTRRTPQIAARNAAAYAMNKTLLGQDNSAPTALGRNMNLKSLKGGSSKTQLFRVTVKRLRSSDMTGSALVAVHKIAPSKWQATVKNGTVNVDW